MGAVGRGGRGLPQGDAGMLPAPRQAGKCRQRFGEDPSPRLAFHATKRPDTSGGLCGAGHQSRTRHRVGSAGHRMPGHPPKSLRLPQKIPETPPKLQRPPLKPGGPPQTPQPPHPAVPPGGRSAEAHGWVPPRGTGGHAGTHRSPPTEAATALPGPARLGTALPGSARRREGSGMWLWEVALKEQPRGRAPRSPTHPTRVLSPPA